MPNPTRLPVLELEPRPTTQRAQSAAERIKSFSRAASSTALTLVWQRLSTNPTDFRTDNLPPMPKRRFMETDSDHSQIIGEAHPKPDCGRRNRTGAAQYCATSPASPASLRPEPCDASQSCTREPHPSARSDDSPSSRQVDPGRAC